LVRSVFDRRVKKARRKECVGEKRKNNRQKNWSQRTSERKCYRGRKSGRSAVPERKVAVGGTNARFLDGGGFTGGGKKNSLAEGRGGKKRDTGLRHNFKKRIAR